MKELHFLFIGINEEIMHTLKRVIENNQGWIAELLSGNEFRFEYLDTYCPDILLLSSGLDQIFESNIREYIRKSGKPIKIIEHYGGGSGLLKSEVYQLFPEWNK